MFGVVFGQVFFGPRKTQCTVLLGQNAQCTVLPGQRTTIYCLLFKCQTNPKLCPRYFKTLLNIHLNSLFNDQGVGFFWPLEGNRADFLKIPCIFAL